jgi:hypothetical protein
VTAGCGRGGEVRRRAGGTVEICVKYAWMDGGTMEEDYGVSYGDEVRCYGSLRES